MPAAKQAALKTADGRIFTAPTHFQAYGVAAEAGVEAEQIVDWGFVEGGGEKFTSASTPSERSDPLEELVEFACTQDRGRCFEGWTRPQVRDYFTFHLRHGTLLFLRDPATFRLMGLGVGWQLNETELAPWQVSRPGFSRPNCSDKSVALDNTCSISENSPAPPAKAPTAHAFDWEPTNPKGDSFLVAEVVATSARAFAALVSEFQWRAPNWRSLKLFTFRRGRLVRYRSAQLFAKLEAYAL